MLVRLPGVTVLNPLRGAALPRWTVQMPETGGVRMLYVHPVLYSRSLYRHLSMPDALGRRFAASIPKRKASNSTPTRLPIYLTGPLRRD
jgi:hypothetical protein